MNVEARLESIVPNVVGELEEIDFRDENDQLQEKAEVVNNYACPKICVDNAQGVAERTACFSIGTFVGSGLVTIVAGVNPAVAVPVMLGAFALSTITSYTAICIKYNVCKCC